MADLKTKPTGEDVERFLNAIPDEQKRQDCFTLLDLMRQASGLEPRIWASSMVGFGEYHYKYASGHAGDAAIVGFAPRKGNLTSMCSQVLMGRSNCWKSSESTKPGKAVCTSSAWMTSICPHCACWFSRRSSTSGGYTPRSFQAEN